MATIKAGTYRFNEEIFVDPDRSITEYFYFTRMDNKSNVVLQAGIRVCIEYGDVVVYYCRDDASLFVGVYRGDWAIEECRTITIDEDPEVSEEFAAWFSANAVEQKPVIKAGTYQFNDVLTQPSADLSQYITFKCNGFTGTGTRFAVFADSSGFRLVYATVTQDNYVKNFAVYESGDGWENTDYRTVTVTEDATANAEFAAWFSANANPTVSGKWKLNSTINCIPYDVYEVGAASPEQRQAFLDTYGANIVPVSTTVDGFTATVSRVSPGIVMGDMYEDGQPADLSEGIVYEADVDGYGKVNGWESADYFCGMTVDFGDELQAVSEVFYNWLIENAAPVVEHTVSGVWKFKDVPTAPSEMNLEEPQLYGVSFACDGITYSACIAAGGDSAFFNIGYSVDPSGDGYTPVYTIGFTDYGYTDGWQSEAYKTIDFGTEPQTVSAEFHEWLNANAIEQTTISGKWKFNDVLVWTSNLDETVDFSCTTTAYNGITYSVVCSAVAFRDEDNSEPEDHVGKYRLYFTAESAEPDLAELGVSLPSPVLCYNNGWQIPMGEGIKTIDFGREPKTVSTEFYNWLNESAEPVVDDKKISGVWKFNEEVNASHDNQYLLQNVNFISNGEEYITILSYWGSENNDVTYVRSESDSVKAFDIGVHTDSQPVWADEAYKVVDFGSEPQPVSDEFYEWFTTNAVEQKQIGGKWRFKDKPAEPDFTGVIPLNFSVSTVVTEEQVAELNILIRAEAPEYPLIPVGTYTLRGTATGLEFYRGVDYWLINALGVEATVSPSTGDEFTDTVLKELTILPNEIYHSIHKQSFEKGFQIITIGDPQVVSPEFYDWMVANTTRPPAAITHNGEEIATLFPGQTAILKCCDKKMCGDVVVTLDENIGGGGSGGVECDCDCKKVSGTWVFNDELTPADAPNTVIGETIALCTSYMDGSNLRTEFVDNMGIVSMKLSGTDYIAVTITENAVSLKNGAKQVSSFVAPENSYTETDGWVNPQWQTITFAGEQTVSTEFYNWLTKNATRKNLNTISGTWVLNDTVAAPDTPFAQFVEFGVNTTVPAYGVDLSLSANVICFGTVDGVVTGRYYVVSSTPDLSSLGMSTPMSFKLYADAWDVASYGEGIKTIAFDGEQEVSDEFYNWLTTNATKQ